MKAGNMATRVYALKLVALCLTAVTAASSFSPTPEIAPTLEIVNAMYHLELTLFSALQDPLQDANVSAATQVLAATVAASKHSRPGICPHQTLNESFSAVHSHMLYASVIGQLVTTRLACTIVELSINDKLNDSV